MRFFAVGSNQAGYNKELTKSLSEVAVDFCIKGLKVNAAFFSKMQLVPTLSTRQVTRSSDLTALIKEPILSGSSDTMEINYFGTESIREKFKKTGLQIIVKMATIELTPDKPEFSMGGWH
ncbi:hypothetical protein BJ878DRAFT_538812 [Calycina marina]|uniref:DUF4246 domain-containing protein n=1 Tax=Calycina marina TaxID=1763456 RepID=A0A9P7Z9S9_9HELO|nr:hypothetical protein BJ878DRAFT_538812 [Calycina marina]